MTALVPDLAPVSVDPALCPREASHDAQARRLRARLQNGILTENNGILNKLIGILKEINRMLKESRRIPKEIIESLRKSTESLRKLMDPYGF